MVAIKIYIEGGGEGKDLDIRFREAWSKFFTSAGLSGRMPRPVRGKGRRHTYDLFCTAITNQQKGEFPLLLLDSEDPFDATQSRWKHLERRDRMEQPGNATEEHLYLMAQVMETWILADLESINSYFGDLFNKDKIPAWHDLEAVPKHAIFDALEKATSKCGHRKYSKGKISFEVFAVLKAHKVAEKCPEAKRLLDFLKNRT